MPTATKVEYLTREDACAQLGLKERRLRDYITAGKIRQADGGLHAGDVARLQEERQGRKATSQLRAISTVAPNLTAEQREQLARASAVARQLGKPAGNETAESLPDCAWLTLDQAAGLSGLPKSVLRKLIESGKLPALDVGQQTGGWWRVHREDLAQLRGDRFRCKDGNLVKL